MTSTPETPDKPDTAKVPLLRRFRKADIVPRLAVIVLGAPCLAIITLRGGVYFLLLIDLIIFLGMREFYVLMSAKGYRPFQALGIFCGLAVSWYMFRGGAAVSLIITGTLLAIMIRELLRRDMAHSLNHIAVTILGVMYVGWLGSHLVMLRELTAPTDVGGDVGARLVFFVAAVTWTGDTAAYMVGILIGRHPLLPRVSPKKTIEGSLGGLVASAAVGWLCTRTFTPFLTPLSGVMLGVVASVFGQLGDLVESLLKRDVGIKDSARLLPGHGGVLDRFDSLFFSGSVLYYYFRFFVV